MKVEGFRELDRLLKELPKRVRSKAMRTALNKASAPVLKAAKSDAPRDTGTLKKSLGRKVQASAAKGKAFAVVGARKGYKGKVDLGRGKNQRIRRRGEKQVASRYLHLVSQGIAGKKRTKPNDFLSKAVEQAKPEDVVSRVFKSVIEQEARRLGKL